MDLKERNRRVYRNTLLGSAVNLLLMLFKLCAGIFGQSAAMVADAAHSLTDFVSDIIILLFQRLSGRPADEDHDYGHGKYETLATALVGGILVVVAAGLFYHGMVDLIAFFRGESLPSPEPIALVAALCSIGLKEVMYRLTIREGRAIKSSVMVANAWSHRSDALSSVGTALAIGLSLVFGQSWAVLDPVAAMGVSLLIFRVAFEMLRDSVEELLEKSLTEEEEAYIFAVIEAEPETTDPHSLRTRRIGSYCGIDVHFRVRGEMTVAQAHEITLRIEKALRERFGKQAVITTHVEPVRTACKCGAYDTNPPVEEEN